MAEQNGTNTGKCAEEYVVKRGDSFYLIAHKLGVPLRDLLAANRDIHPARLMVGDVLCVPREEDDSPQTGGLGGSGTTQTTQVTGMVQATGTTQTTQVTGMAQATGTTQATGATQATGTTQAVQPTCMTGQIAPDTTLSCTEDEQWTVQKGQTVSDLQLRGLVSRHTLETANPGVDLENLSVGQTVCIPRDNVPCELPETYTLAATETLEAVAMRFNLPVASLLRANPCLAPQDFEGGVTVILPR